MNYFYENQNVYQAVAFCPGGSHINMYTRDFLNILRKSVKQKWDCSHIIFFPF